MPNSPQNLRWQYQLDSFANLADALGHSCSFEATPQKPITFELFDSFDQSLRAAGLSLQFSKGRYTLASAFDLTSGALSIRSARRAKKRFWHDFPPSKFRDRLEPILKLRAATPLATVTLEPQVYTLRNRDDKIVARLHEDRLAVSSSDSTRSYLELRPLLGYDEEAAQISETLDAATGLTRQRSPALDWVLQAAGQAKPPLDASQAIQLSIEQDAQSAVAQIGRFMIASARQNEPGITADIDTEFLHDYRVSIRKLRSVLSLVKGVYPKGDTKRLKATFADFARKTNRLRDLDVYLMEEDRFRSMLPESLQAGLPPLFETFRSERQRELSRVRRHLRSPSYQEAISAQMDWLFQSTPPKGPRSDLPIGQLSAREIHLHYRKVAKKGAALKDSTPDAEVHELRIECKKLRYLLELFSSLYPAGEIKAIIRQLKGLQNVLGQFNDYTVQQLSLAELLANAPELGRNTAAAIGGLIAHLRQGQLAAREQVSKKFLQFNDESMKLRFKRLFATDRKAAS